MNRRGRTVTAIQRAGYARLAHDHGRIGDRRIIPGSWVHAATTVPPESWHLKPYAAPRYFGYGYQTWIFPGERRNFALLGVRGHAVYIDPASKLALVHTACPSSTKSRSARRASPCCPSARAISSSWKVRAPSPA